jgi:hypothetical protein
VLPGIIRKCPFKSFKVYNATLSLTEEEKQAVSVPNRTLTPNGFYRNRLAFYDDLDDNIGEITYYYERYFYMKDSELK